MVVGKKKLLKSLNSIDEEYVRKHAIVVWYDLSLSCHDYHPIIILKVYGKPNLICGE